MKRLFILLCLILGLTPLKTYSEYWAEFEMKKALLEKVNIEVNSRLRFSGGLNELYNYRTEVGAVVQLNEFTKAGLYFENKQKMVAGKWEGTNCIGLGGDLTYNLYALSLMDRNRIDYDNFEDWVYRNLLKLSYPYVLAAKTGYYGHPPLIYRIGPCLDEEIYFNINETKVVENRVTLGVRFEMLPYTTFKVAGMLESKNTDTWRSIGVIVTTLELFFLQID